MDRAVQLSPRKFILLVASTMTMVALGIDTLLPAFPKIREHLGLRPDDAHVGFLITVFMLGIGLGQPLVGPLSDRFGRRPVLIACLGLYALSAFATTTAPSLTLMLIARLLWGLAAAGPRTMAMAMIRDTFEGVEMAKTLSYVMSIFVIVPILAPTVGAAALHLGGWRVTVGFPGAMALLLLLAVARSPETLAISKRRPFDTRAIVSGFREVAHIRSSMSFAFAVALISGAVSSYLSVTEQIIDQTYDRGSQFALIFGGIAAIMAITTFTNARLVGRFGLTTMLRVLPVIGVVLTVSIAVVSVASHGRPPFAFYVVAMSAILGVQMFIVPNTNTAAMQPVGHLAGVASGIIGSIATVFSALLGMLVGALQTTGTNVLTVSIAIFFVVALVLIRFGQSGE